MQFIPNESEKQLTRIIQKYCRNEFAVIRMTFTMLDKSTIDASESIRRILAEDCDLLFELIPRGEKYYDTSLVLIGQGIYEPKTSFYHPNAKSQNSMGDPRFWIYGLKQMVTQNELIYFTSFNGKLLVIPLVESERFESNLIDIFGGVSDSELVLQELLRKFRQIQITGWIPSIAPNRIFKGLLQSAPKDAGETFEYVVGVDVNNLRSADYQGEIELKTKRNRATNNDTLFSKVPDWDISRIKSSAEMILTYGYPARKTEYAGYQDLYVTVSNTPNNQGLYLCSDDNESVLNQYYSGCGSIVDTASWKYESLRESLMTKHKRTLWVVVEEAIIDNKLYFKFLSAELTEKPIFSQFISLIDQGIVTYDWRGRVKFDGTAYKDKGHAFRMHNRNRELLFGESRKIGLLEQ